MLSEENIEQTLNQIKYPEPCEEWRCHFGKEFAENKRESINKSVFKERFFFPPVFNFFSGNRHCLKITKPIYVFPNYTS